MQTADLAVILPVYNRAHVVKESLDGVAAQRPAPRCLIIVDDGSTDGTSELLREWADASRDFEVIIERQDNQGPAKARNRALEIGPRTEFVAFLDSDDVWPNDFIARCLPKLAGDPEAVATIGDRAFSQFPASPEHYADQQWNNMANLPANPVTWLMRHGTGISSCCIIRRSAIEQWGGFDESHRAGEDVLFYLRLGMAGRWIHCPGAPTLYKHSVQSRYGDEPNLSNSIKKNTTALAEVHEYFFAEYGAQTGVSALDRRRHVARLWRLAGNAASTPAEARACYAKSIKKKPWSLQTWRALVATFV